MELAMIGLGKMGSNMARRLRRDGHRVIGFDIDVDTAEALAEEAGTVPAATLADAVDALQQTPRTAWVMVPAGDPVQSVVADLRDILQAGDIVVDGGNSNYQGTVRLGRELSEKGIHYVDVGTSGGVWGLEQGYSMMVGGPQAAVAHLRPALETLAPGPEKGWGHVGPTGAGHFVKMVHNGIEYGMMQSIAEGFEIMKAKESFELDLHQVAEIWRFGSVIKSWLIDLTALALEEDQDLEGIRGWVADSGEGRWTVLEAIDQDIPAPVITLSLMARFTSRQEESYGAKLLAALRNQFGGHAVKKSDE